MVKIFNSLRGIVQLVEIRVGRKVINFFIGFLDKIQDFKVNIEFQMCNKEFLSISNIWNRLILKKKIVLSWKFWVFSLFLYT